MNFLEICQEVVIEADIDSGLITTTEVDATSDPLHVKIVHWVRQQNRRIQRKSDAWKFHHHVQEQMILSEANVELYDVGNVKEILRDSLKVRRAGTTGEWPMTYLSYREWLDMFKIRPVAVGMPTFFVWMPDRSVKLYPIPNGDYEVIGDWWDGIVELEGDASEPPWDKDYHEILVWFALASYAEEFDSTELEARIQTNLTPMWNSFMREYLPDIETPGGFM